MGLWLGCCNSSFGKESKFIYCYRPQRSCEGYVFTPVCLSIAVVSCLSACWEQSTHSPSRTRPSGTRHPLQDQTPAPGADPPREQTADGPWLRTATACGLVRILLECILVITSVHHHMQYSGRYFGRQGNKDNRSFP